MPLKKGSSRKTISHNIKVEMDGLRLRLELAVQLVRLGEHVGEGIGMRAAHRSYSEVTPVSENSRSK